MSWEERHGGPGPGEFQGRWDGHGLRVGSEERGSERENFHPQKPLHQSAGIRQEE